MLSQLVRCTRFTGLIVLIVFTSSTAAHADFLANFDTFAEGPLAPIGGSFSDGGITFSSLDQGNSRFIAEQAGSSLGAAFSAPNALGFGGFSPGPGYGFGIVHNFDMTSGTLVGSASLDLWSGNDVASVNNTITLTGFRNNAIVNQSSFTLLSATGVTYIHFILPAGIYDRFEVAGSGPNNNGIFYALVDNVRFTDAVLPAASEPTTLWLAALLLPLLGRIRRYTVFRRTLTI